MNKTDLAQRVALATDLSEAAATTAVDSLFGAIRDAVAAGEKVAIAKFGVFEAKSRKERQGRNPRTGEAITIPAARTVGFKPAAALKEALK